VSLKEIIKYFEWAGGFGVSEKGYEELTHQLKKRKTDVPQ